MIVTPQDRGSFYSTYTCKRFYPLDPRPEDICIEDIAHALSLGCRFAGHLRDFYSVAEHSVRGSFEVPEEYAFEFLMHDASEAYIVDIPRPLKYCTAMSGYREIEENVQNVINMKYGLPLEMHPSVKEADNRMLCTEQRDLRPGDPEILKLMVERMGVEPYSFHIKPWSPYVAEQNFLLRFKQLYGARA